MVIAHKMRYLLDLHKKRDLKTDNQETNNMVIAQKCVTCSIYTKRGDLKTWINRKQKDLTIW